MQALMNEKAIFVTDFSAIPESYEHLYTLYFAPGMPVYSMVQKTFQDSIADDVLQDVFLACQKYHILENFDSAKNTKFSTYLFTIVKNKIETELFKLAKQSRDTVSLNNTFRGDDGEDDIEDKVIYNSVNAKSYSPYEPERYNTALDTLRYTYEIADDLYKNRTGKQARLAYLPAILHAIEDADSYDISGVEIAEKIFPLVTNAAEQTISRARKDLKEMVKGTLDATYNTKPFSVPARVDWTGVWTPVYVGSGSPAQQASSGECRSVPVVEYLASLAPKIDNRPGLKPGESTCLVA
jgi:DNA-directed RNA polymerase specialized sigma24 family protein